ncbi:MAG: CBS domain-containing protein [Gemmatimonadota bacterium]
MKVSEIMTASPTCCAPTDSLREVAQIMRACDCGAVPVVQDDRVVGIVTDRDLAIRAVAEGKSADTKVSEVLTASPCCCSPNEDVDEVSRTMSEKQIRRVVIVDASGCCVGIVSQADLARAAQTGSQLSDREVGIVVERISEPQQASNSSSAPPASAEPAART